MVLHKIQTLFAVTEPKIFFSRSGKRLRGRKRIGESFNKF